MALFFSPDPSHEDIKTFMDDDEHEYWDTQKGSPEGRLQFWKSLEDLWCSIPDPTEDQLRQLMRPEDWQGVYEHGDRGGVLSFYRRKWKKDRKSAAIEAQRTTVDAKPPEPESPKPEPEQPKPDTTTSGKSNLVDEWYSDDPNDVSWITGRRRKFTAIRIPAAEPTPTPVQQKIARTDAEDRALRKREELLKREERLQSRRESERKQESLRNWTRQLGFTPLDELPRQDALDRKADTDKPPEAVSQAANNVRLRNALELLTQHPKLSAGGGATVFLIAAVSLEFSGGKPWKVGVAAAIGYLLAFLLLVFVFYEAKLFAKHRKGAIAVSGVIFLAMAAVWYLLLPDTPLTAQQIAAEVWKQAPTPTPLQSPSPVSSVQQPEDPQFIPISDKIGVPTRVGGRTLYPQMQLEYNSRTDVFRLAVYVGSTDLTAEVCTRLLESYPRLKTTIVKNVEESSEAWSNLKIKGLTIVYKGRLTKEQIKQIETYAKKLKMGLVLEGPSLP